MTTQPATPTSRPVASAASLAAAPGVTGASRRTARWGVLAGGLGLVGTLAAGFQFYSLETSRSLWLKVQAQAPVSGMQTVAEQALADLDTLHQQAASVWLVVLAVGGVAAWRALTRSAAATSPVSAAESATWSVPRTEAQAAGDSATAFMPLSDDPTSRGDAEVSSTWSADALRHLSADAAVVVPPAASPSSAMPPTESAPELRWIAPSRPLVQSEVVHHAVLVAQRGGEVVSQVVANMEDIAASSRKINEVLATIDSIAVQTNILALNAAVQSARARQEGRSGDNVAGEVRLLAQRAASAAKEIKTLINASAEKAEFGDRLVRDASTTMDAMVSSVQSVTDLVGQIATAEADDGRSVALLQVDVSVQRLDDLTRQHQGLVEQSTSAAESLRQQAERLQKVVGAFRLLQQTQEAAWEAHTVIHTVRASARAETRPGGLDDLGNNGKPGGDWASF